MHDVDHNNIRWHVSVCRMHDIDWYKETGNEAEQEAEDEDEEKK